MFGIHGLPDNGASDASADGQSGAIGLVQHAESAPSTGGETSVQVSFGQSQVAGDLNIVVVGWYGGTPPTKRSRSPTPSHNVYTAISPNAVLDQSGYAITQYLYYAANIADGESQVTVAWAGGSADSPDVRVLEYKGLQGFDQAAESSGLAKTGSVKFYDHDNELLFFAGTSGASMNFAPASDRQFIGPLDATGGNFDAYQIVSQQGSYEGDVTATGNGVSWVLQLAAFY